MACSRRARARGTGNAGVGAARHGGGVAGVRVGALLRAVEALGGDVLLADGVADLGGLGRLLPARQRRKHRQHVGHHVRVRAKVTREPLEQLRTHSNGWRMWGGKRCLTKQEVI
jgi:hypothetical protein